MKLAGINTEQAAVVVTDDGGQKHHLPLTPEQIEKLMLAVLKERYQR